MSRASKPQPVKHTDAQVEEEEPRNTEIADRAHKDDNHRKHGIWKEINIHPAKSDGIYDDIERKAVC